MPWTAIAAGIGALASGMGQHRANQTNVKLARERMAFEDSQAARQMAFQERMSGTEVQRRMEDLRKAGINPILAGGYAASSPSGAAGSGAQASVGSVVPENIGSSAIAAMTARKSLQLLDAQVDKARADAGIAREQGQVALMDRIRRNAEHGFYFNGDGSPRGPLRTLLQRQYDSAIANSARDVSQAEMLRLSVPEQRAIASMFDQKHGDALAGFQRILPLLLMLNRARK